MHHTLRVERYGFGLRPVQRSDAGFIVELRNGSHALGRIGDSARTVEDQEAWLEGYYARQGDYCFIIERSADAKPVGMLGVYGIDGEVGEWGRWVVVPGVPAAAASAWMALHVCFDVLRLGTVRGRVVETNGPVLSFHRRIGYQEMGRCQETTRIGGREVGMIEFQATRSDWPRMSEVLGQYASLVCRLENGGLSCVGK